MMRSGVLATAITLCALGSAGHCAVGPVTVWFEGTSGDASDRLALLCADRDAQVVEQDDRHVVCQKPVSGGKGILTQALLGGSSSTAPTLNIRFAILRDGNAVRVLASQWIELQTAAGQVRRTDLDGSKNRQELMDVLIAAGAHNVPPQLLEPESSEAAK